MLREGLDGEYVSVERLTLDSKVTTNKQVQPINSVTKVLLSSFHLSGRNLGSTDATIYI